MSWRERFGMQAAPLPRGAAGETFFDQDPHYQRLARAFAWLAAEPGIGVLTGEPGVGKTSAMRHLCRQLPGHEHRVVYLCDCAVKPLDLYRMLAAELGLRPGPRAQIVADIKRALVSLVDERGVVPIVILDDAQGLRDDLLHEFHGLTSLDFDGREYLTIWLVGHPLLVRRLRLQQNAALAQRVVIYAPLLAKTDPLLFDAMLDHGLAAAFASIDLTPPTPAASSNASPAASPASSATSSASPSPSPTNAASRPSTSSSSTPPPSSSSSRPSRPPSRPQNPATTATRDHGDNATRHTGAEGAEHSGGDRQSVALSPQRPESSSPARTSARGKRR